MIRILDASASDFAAMSGRDLKESIAAAEGRTVMAEVVVVRPPLVDGVTNVELAAAFGADLVLLNFYDVRQPLILGLPSVKPEDDQLAGLGSLPLGVGRTAGEVGALIGRPVGINLEPAAEGKVSPGRRATADNARLAKKHGVAFITVTGNPHTGVTNEGIVRAVHEIREALGDDILLIAGKMHAAGVRGEAAEKLVREEDVRAFVAAGADCLLLPAPGTVPGITGDMVQQWVKMAHGEGALAMTAIGTSQEGADEGTIRQLALAGKMTGADIAHIGDAGFSGIALPENIMALSIAIKGKRHTYRRMALSPKR